MATIEDSSAAGRPGFAAYLRQMEDGELLAQDIVQQGAVHAISTLLTMGCTEANAAAVLASLRENALQIRQEAVRRGKPSLFSNDQTFFN